MRAAVAVLIVCIGFASCAELSQPKAKWDNDWKIFKSSNGKSYKNGAEENRRRMNWEKRREQVEKHNAEAASGKHSYTKAINKLSDMSNEELAALTRAILPKNVADAAAPAAPVSTRVARSTVPLSVDMRNDSCMPPVKDQRQCGSCWAFASNTPVEYNLCKKTGYLQTLSEQQLVDCTRSYGNNGCNGGWYYDAWRYLSASAGQACSLAYPYKAIDQSCKYNPAQSVGKVLTHYSVARDAAAMEAALVNSGPLAVAFQVLDSFFSYRSGIYSDPTCPSDVYTLNHAVVVVGYGSLNGIPYWIARNSWGASWGDRGYFLIRKGVNMCNIESWVAYPVVSP